MEQSHDFSVSYEQHPSPTLLAYTRLLELPAWKLEQTIQYEVSQNPALELTEQDTCKRCGSVREDGIASIVWSVRKNIIAACCINPNALTTTTKISTCSRW